MIKDYLQKLDYEAEVLRMKGDVLDYINGRMKKTHEEEYTIIIGQKLALTEVCKWCYTLSLGVNREGETTTARIALA